MRLKPVWLFFLILFLSTSSLFSQKALPFQQGTFIRSSIYEKTNKGRQILQNLKLEGFKTVTDDDFSDFRKLYNEIQSYVPDSR